MNPELAVESLILGLPREHLALSEIHDVLRQVAELVGQRPQRVTGPAVTYHWRLGERGIAVGVSMAMTGSDDERSLSFVAFPWSEREDELHRAFKWSEARGYPYLWDLPIAGGHNWWPDAATSTDWSTFFDVFGACFDALPRHLQTIPPDWRPSTTVVDSMWNMTGPGGGTSVNVSADGVVISGGSPGHEFELTVPADRLGRNGVSVPAVLAGLTESASFAELEFWENETRMDFFPVGLRAGEAEELGIDLSAETSPTATLSIEEAQTLLAEPAPEPRPRRSREKRPENPFAPTMPAAEAAERVSELVARGGGSVGLTPRDAGVDDLRGTWTYGNELTMALVNRYGPPVVSGANCGASGERLWRVGDAGMHLRIRRQRVELEATSWSDVFPGMVGVSS